MTSAACKYYGGQIALRWEPIEGLAITPRVMYQQTGRGRRSLRARQSNNLLQRQLYDVNEGGTDKWWLDSLTINYTAPFGNFVSSTAYFDRKTFETEDDTDFTEYAFGLTHSAAVAHYARDRSAAVRAGTALCVQFLRAPSR